MEWGDKTEFSRKQELADFGLGSGCHGMEQSLSFISSCWLFLPSFFLPRLFYLSVFVSSFINYFVPLGFTELLQLTLSSPITAETTVLEKIVKAVPNFSRSYKVS
jgi:hypothetical protein